MQNALVVAQVALSLVLLIAAGLVLRTMRNILGIDLGFRAERVLVASMDLSLAGYTEERARLLTPQLLERLAAVPGVDSVSLAKTYPRARLGRPPVDFFTQGRSRLRTCCGAEATWAFAWKPTPFRRDTLKRLAFRWLPAAILDRRMA